MANAVKVAKNTFAEGLIMDFAPDSSSSNSLSSALNATFITFNGNEMSLQNDMGNGRVETARLPDGYVPVGTCEFGDIIYIVSYNPLINKCQIGCFPSPERNISSEEVGNTAQTIKASDFQELSEGKPTGKLKAHSAKYILYQKTLNPGDKYIIYSNEKDSIKNNESTITDIGNTSHIPGTLPRLMRLHVVSIEDSGKITYLDTSVKWYDKGQLDYFIQNTGNSNSNNATGTVDIDSYRSLVSSAYSIFNSKVSGKLAILAELEEISGFSCTYDVYSETNKDNTKNHSIYFDFNWETENPDTNPSYVVLTKSEWASSTPKVYYSGDKEGSNLSIDLPKAWPNYGYWHTEISQPSYPKDREYGYSGYQMTVDKLQENGLDELILTQALNDNGRPNIGYYYKNIKSIKNNKGSFIYLDKEGKEINAEIIQDSIVNNYYHSSILKEFHTFQNIPYQKKEIGETEGTVKKNPDKIKKAYIENGIYHYQVAPAMEYGILEQYAIDGYIDLNKINSGEIALTGWRYYNTENNSTLTFEIEAYPEQHKGISEVVLEFYDNQGFAAAYHIRNRKSYSGTFTEYIPLNGEQQDYKLDYIKADGTIGTHLGLPVNKNDYENWNNNKGDSKYEEYIKSNLFPDYGPYFKNDAGILYSGIVYLVKVIVKYCSKDALGNYKDDYNLNKEFKDTTFYRWMWTNTLFNDRYYDTRDYDNLLFTLNLDLSVQYSEGSDYNYKVYDYKPTKYTAGDPSANMCAKVQQLKGSINAMFDAQLSNNYGTYLLNADTIYQNGISIRLYDGMLKMNNNPEDVDYVHTGEILSNNLVGIQPIIDTKEDWYKINEDNSSTYNTLWGSKLCELLSINNISNQEGENNPELWQDYKNYKNCSFMEIQGASSDDEIPDDAYYMSITGEPQQLKNLKSIKRNLKENFKINTNNIHFSKYYHDVYYTTVDATSVYSLISNTDDLTTYNLYYEPDSEDKPEEGGHIYMSTGFTLGLASYGDDNHWQESSISKHIETGGKKLIFNSEGTQLTDNLKQKDYTQFAGYTKEGLDGVARLGSMRENTPETWNNIMGDSTLMVVGYRSDINKVDPNESLVYLQPNNKRISSDYNPKVSETFFENVLKPNGITIQQASFWSGKGVNLHENMPAPQNSENYSVGQPNKGFMMLGFNNDTKDNFHILNNGFILPYSTSNQYHQYFDLTTATSEKEAMYYPGCDYIITYVILKKSYDIVPITTNYRENGQTTTISVKAYRTWAGNIQTNADFNFVMNYYKDSNYDVYIVISEKSRPSYINFIGYSYNDIVKNYRPTNNFGAPTIFSSEKDFAGDVYEPFNYPSIIPPTSSVTASYHNNINSYEEVKKLINYQNSKYYPVSSTLKNVYIGDLIASTLGSMYYVKGQDSALMPQIKDTVFLANNYTSTTKELVAQSMINHTGDNDNKFIAIGQNMDYNTYIIAITEKFKDAKINRSNVDLKLQNCVKTFPLTINYEYLKPLAESMSSDFNTVVHVFGGGTILLNTDGLVTNKLYELTTENNLRALSLGHSVQYYSKFGLDSLDNILTLNSMFNSDTNESYIFKEPNKYLKNMFTFDDGILKLNRADPPSDSKCFSISTYRRKSAANLHLCLKDLIKDEVLIPALKIF